MKKEIIFIKGLNKEITFYIGRNQNENFNIIDLANLHDLWFHARDYPSCHVISIIPDNLNKKDLKYIIKNGCLICKKYTNKIKSLQNIEFVYTQIKNIHKTNVLGCVEIKHEKIIKL